MEKFSFHTIKRAAIVISVFLNIGYVGLSQTLSGGKVNELDRNFSEVQVYSSAMSDVVLWLIGFGGLFCLGLLIFRLIKSRQKFSQINRQNELFLQSTIESVIFCDLNGVITFCNDATVKMFDYSREEMIGRSISEFYALSGEFEMVNDALNYRNEFKGEIVNLRKNGDQFISQLSSNSIFNKNGVKTGTMGISRDITEKKESDDRFQHIIDNATDIIYTTNIQGEITYINMSAKSVLGYSNEDFLGMSFRKLIHPDDLEFVQNHYNEQFKSRAKETYLECRMVKANGEGIWIGQNVKTRFSHTNPNLITGFFGILRNLDEIKQVQLSLAESELKYRELFDNSTDLIQSVDPNGQFLFVNPSWKKTLGYEDYEIQRLNFYDILHPDSKEQCELLIEEILKVGDVADQKEHTFKMITKSKREVVLKGGLSVQFEAGQIVAIQSFFRDVTQQELIEAALVKSQENFKIISSSINDVFFLFDVITGQYDYISSNCETVLSVTPEYFYSGKNFAKEYLTPDDQILMSEMHKKLRNGENANIEYGLMIDGGIRWINEDWFAIKDSSGKTVSISGICRDITKIKIAYNIIYQQNTEISQSIHYAKNIQESTLPTPAEVKQILPESFVLYRSKDVLSGDLYLIDEVHLEDGELCPVFVVGDCTGHGVPGGLLSLLCSGLLTESITNPRIQSPAQALDFVREKLIRLFRSNPSKYILDGMDAAFCVLSRAKKELYFSGANMSCYLVRENEVIEIAGDKQHIGYNSVMAPFVPITIDIEVGDMVYLTTDGYVDQFGGEKDKKFLRKRLTKLLAEINNLGMSEQHKHLEDAFLDWKGNEDQTDDIVLIGVRI